MLKIEKLKDTSLESVSGGMDPDNEGSDENLLNAIYGGAVLNDISDALSGQTDRFGSSNFFGARRRDHLAWPSIPSEGKIFIGGCGLAAVGVVGALGCGIAAAVCGAKARRSANPNYSKAALGLGVVSGAFGAAAAVGGVMAYRACRSRG